MKWFKHDSDANADAKLKKVRIKYGMEGYGLYWYCLEMIASEVSKDKLTFELEHDSEIIAHDTGIHYERVQEMMTYMVNLGLFEESSGVVTCLKMAQRLDQSMTSNPAMRKLIDNMKKTNADSHDAIMTESENVMQDKIRIEQNREENIGRSNEPTQRAKAIYIMEQWNQIAVEQKTLWQRVGNPEITSNLRFQRVGTAITWIAKYLKKKGEPNDWPAIADWVNKLLLVMAEHDFYSGHRNNYRLKLEQAFRNDYLIQMVDDLKQQSKQSA